MSLELVKIKDPLQRQGILSGFQVDRDCFVVSDIKTKLFIESNLLKKHNALPGPCVLRAYEFYKEVFYSLNLHWILAPDFFVREMFAEFCAKYPQPWVKNLQNTNFFLDLFNVFLPGLFHPESSQLFTEWFEKNPHSPRWKPWVKLSQEFFNHLQAKHILPESGIKAVLLHNLPSLNTFSFPKKRIFLDLAFSIDLSEKEIFKEISRHIKVCVLSPELESNLPSLQNFDVYQKLEEELGPKQVSFSQTTKDKKNPAPSPVKVFKTQSRTQLEETKKAVAQVCKWLHEKVPPQDIVIFAPHIEDYWFSLKICLEKEGIPVKKSVNSLLAGFPDIKYFLSAIRLHLGKFSFGDLEHFSFYKNSKKEFSKFKSSYFHVPDRELAKNLLFKEKILNPDKKITGSKFIAWALSFWPKDGKPELLEELLRIFQTFCMEESLKAYSWLCGLESLVFARDIELKEEDPKGISCLSFNALFSLQSPYAFIMGLSEKSLQSHSFGNLNESDRQSLLNDLGIPLSLSHPKAKENSLLWFLQSLHHKELYLSFHKYNFNGDIQTPNLLWFLSKFLLSAKETEISESLSWDANKKQGRLPDILKGSSMERKPAKALANAFESYQHPFFHKEELKLSPNRLKIYTKCPFKYAAEKLFFVQEAVHVEREFASISKGGLAHRLFEKVLTEYPDLKLEKEQAEDLIQSLKPPGEELIYKKQWLLLKSYLQNLLHLFLQKERESREQFPFLQPIAFEKDFSARWDQNTGTLRKKGKYLFNARIDRIDRDERKNYVIRDYKASGASLANITSWIKKDKEELQLIFYAQALEEALIEDLPAGNAAALFYSIYDDEFSAKGFVEKGSSVEKIMGKTRGHKKPREDLDKAISASNQKAQEVVWGMERGRFFPKPKDREICKKCSCQNWCRVETVTSSTKT